MRKRPTTGLRPQTLIKDEENNPDKVAESKLAIARKVQTRHTRAKALKRARQQWEKEAPGRKTRKHRNGLSKQENETHEGKRD